MSYLVDTSAAVRIWRRQVNPDWHGLIKRGLLVVCEPVLAETLRGIDAKRYARTEEEFRDAYVVATVPDNIWDLVAVLQRELVPHAAHQGVSVVDLVVAATAIRLKLEVLHEDGDFETLARHVPQLKQRRVSTGPPA